MENRQEVTYQQLADIVIDFIKANCKNYPNLNNMPAYYKNGYSSTYSKQFGTYATVNFKRTLTNTIVAVSEATIKNDMNAFLTNTLGIGSYLNTPVNNKNFFNYLCNLVSFCTTKINILTSNDFNAGDVTASGTTSKATTYTLLVYVPANTSYQNIQPLSKEGIGDATGSTYTASEIEAQLQAMLNHMSNSKLKVANNSYTFTISV